MPCLWARALLSKSADAPQGDGDRLPFQSKRIASALKDFRIAWLTSGRRWWPTRLASHIAGAYDLPRHVIDLIFPKK